MIVFSRRLAEELGEHALKERPNEACGILAGRRNGKKIMEKVYRCKNISRHPESRYTIGSEEMLHAFKDAEERGLEILGFYHSHPFAMDHPSSIDEEMAAWSEYSYVIVSDRGGHCDSKTERLALLAVGRKKIR